MNFLGSVITIVFLLLFSTYIWRRWQRSVKAEYIRSYCFPPLLYEKLRKLRPELSDEDCQSVGRALRQFFLAYLYGGCRFVAMPSQIVDDLWHEQILYTRHYQMFCKKAFGRFLHHTPAAVLSKNRKTNSGLRRVWCLSCRQEKIDPRKPDRLPLLFAIDQKLNIVNGFVYTPDCKALRAGGNTSNLPYCGGDFSSADYDGSTEGFDDSGSAGDSSSDGGDSGGCGGGCGGGD